MTKNEYLFKILIIGDSSAGKTSFIRRYVHQLFSNYYKATIGIDFAIKTLNFDGNKTIRLHLWDIAGQDRTMGAMTRVYYKDAVGAFLVFDLNKLNKLETLNSVLNWKKDLDSKVSLSNGESIPVLLIANKCDLVKKQNKINNDNPFENNNDDNNNIDYNENEKLLKEFVDENNFIGFEYTSAKFNMNIESAANVLIEKILQKQDQIDNELVDDHFDNNNNNNLKSNCCNNRQFGSIIINSFCCKKKREQSSRIDGSERIKNTTCCQ